MTFNILTTVRKHKTLCDNQVHRNANNPDTKQRAEIQVKLL